MVNDRAGWSEESARVLSWRQHAVGQVDATEISRLDFQGLRAFQWPPHSKEKVIGLSGVEMEESRDQTTVAHGAQVIVSQNSSGWSLTFSAQQKRERKPSSCGNG